MKVWGGPGASGAWLTPNIFSSLLPTALQAGAIHWPERYEDRTARLNDGGAPECPSVKERGTHRTGRAITIRRWELLHGGQQVVSVSRSSGNAPIQRAFDFRTSRG